MAIKCMTDVWEHSTHKGSALLIMLAIADMCNDDRWCYPSIPTLAKMARMTERNAQLTIRKCEESGELKVHPNLGIETAKGWTNRYEIMPYGVKRASSGEVGFTPEVKAASPLGMKSVSPLEVKPTSPKPPVEPSIDPSIDPAAANGADQPIPVFKLYTDATGQLLTEMIGGELKLLAEEYPHDWLVDAFRETALNGARKLNYTRAILERWQREGKPAAGTGSKPPAKPAAPARAAYPANLPDLQTQLLEDDDDDLQVRRPLGVQP